MALVAAGVVVQAAMPAVPLMLQLAAALALLGATVPGVPVTVAVKVMVEGTDPPPLEVSTTVGVALAMITVIGVVAASAK